MIRFIVKEQSYGGCELGVHPTTNIKTFTDVVALEQFLRQKESMCSKQLIGYELIPEDQ